MLGPSTAAYLIVAAFLFATGALGVLIRRSPLIVLLSLEIMLNGANLALIAFSRHFAERRRADLRARRDGGRRLRGRRRPRADRRDGPQEAHPRRRQALDPARMTRDRAAWICLLLPLASACADHAARRRASLAARPAGSRRSRPAGRSRPPSSSSARCSAARPTTAPRLSPRRLARAGELQGRLLDPDRPALGVHDADRHRSRIADRRVLARLHGRRGRGAPVLRVHVAVRLLDADARAGRQPAVPADRLGPRRPLVLPADRLPPRAAERGRRREEGVHHERVRRRDHGARPASC